MSTKFIFSLWCVSPKNILHLCIHFEIYLLCTCAICWHVPVGEKKNVMGILKVPNIASYWENGSSLSSFDGICVLFSRTRFCDIYSILYLLEYEIPRHKLTIDASMAPFHDVEALKWMSCIYVLKFVKRDAKDSTSIGDSENW